MNDRDRRNRHEDHGPGDGARPSVSPGKRTLTMSLPPRAGGAAPAPVQRKRAAAAGTRQDAGTERWTEVVMRPDLHGAPVQRKAAGRDGDAGALPASGGGKAMPAEVQARMEGSFGADFSAVRIHEGPRSEALGALAYTQGTDVHFAPGQYQPESQSGQELLGHELAHVVQQGQGRVSATTQAKGVAVNDDAGLEAEADAMGARAARGERVSDGELASARSSTGSAVQRMVTDKEEDEEKETVSPPAYLYHSAKSDRIRRIREQGMLISMVGTGATAIAKANTGRELQEDHDRTMLHFGDRSWATGYYTTLGTACLLRIKTSALDTRSLSSSGNEWRYGKDVPPDAIEILLADKTTWQALTATKLLISEGGPEHYQYPDDDSDEEEDW